MILRFDSNYLIISQKYKKTNRSGSGSRVGIGGGFCVLVLLQCAKEIDEDLKMTKKRIFMNFMKFFF